MTKEQDWNARKTKGDLPIADCHEAECWKHGEKEPCPQCGEGKEQSPDQASMTDPVDTLTPKILAKALEARDKALAEDVNDPIGAFNAGVIEAFRLTSQPDETVKLRKALVAVRPIVATCVKGLAMERNWLKQKLKQIDDALGDPA